MNAALNFINLPLYNKQASQQVLIVNADTTTSNNLQYSLSNIANTTTNITQPKSQDVSNQYDNARAMANALNSQSTTNNSSTLNKPTILTNTGNFSINCTSTDQSAENHQGNENFIWVNYGIFYVSIPRIN